MIDRLTKRIESFYSFTGIEFGLVRIFYCIIYYLIYALPFKIGLGTVPDYLFAPNSSSIAYYLVPSIPDEFVFLVLNVIGTIAFVCILFGYNTKLAGVVFSLILIFECSILYSFQKIDHTFFNDLTFLVLGFTGWGGRISVDEYLGKKSFINNVWLVNFTLLFFFAMFSAGIFKLMDSSYLNLYVHHVENLVFRYDKGTDFYQFLNGFFPFGDSFFAEILDYIAVCFELGVFLVLINLRWSLIYIGLCCVFHIVNYKMLAIAFSGLNAFYLVIILITFFMTINTNRTEKIIRNLIIPKVFYVSIIILPTLYIFGYTPTPILIKKIGYINLHLIYLIGVFLSLYRLPKKL